MKISNLVISKAASKDYPRIADLLEAASLPVDGTEAVMSDMLVLKVSDRIVGCAALESYGTSALLRSVAVDGDHRHIGWGSALVRAILDLARTMGIQEIYLLTETAPTFFERHGFQIVRRDDFAEPVKNSREFSLICPRSAVAMKLRLS
ncbi:MAG: GNAT family N-acetyltransferase [Candidatus Hydrogenedentota bacterium]|nr:MAG: GNAT family N-acetyltransferase [Candidatus Hydrogenedentota bacterium]